MGEQKREEKERRREEVKEEEEEEKRKGMELIWKLCVRNTCMDHYRLVWITIVEYGEIWIVWKLRFCMETKVLYGNYLCMDKYGLL